MLSNRRPIVSDLDDRDEAVCSFLIGIGHIARICHRENTTLALSDVGFVARAAALLHGCHVVLVRRRGSGKSLVNYGDGVMRRTGLIDGGVVRIADLVDGEELPAAKALPAASRATAEAPPKEVSSLSLPSWSH